MGRKDQSRDRRELFGPGESESSHHCLAVIDVLLRVIPDRTNDGFHRGSHDNSSSGLTQLTGMLYYERVYASSIALFS